MFVTLRLKKFFVGFSFLLVVFLLSFGIISVYTSSVSSGALKKLTIVLDAGHGGRDGGSVGVATGVKESDLNLQIVKKLQSYLSRYGFNIVLTRHDEHGLYNVFGRDYKLEDMNKRREIIKNNQANLVVSIHMNSFRQASQKGIQAYYDDGLQTGKELATVIQEQFIKGIANAKPEPSKGDYYILKGTQNPSVLIECGFLSNAEEEALLQTDEYQESIAYNIFYGIIKYLQVLQN